MIDSKSVLVAAKRGKPLSGPQQRHRLNTAAGYLMLGMTDQALRELDSFGETESVPAILLRAEVYRELTRHGDAVALYERVLAAEPGSLEAYIGKAWCLKRLARLDDAIETLRVASTKKPREALIQYNLACYFALQDDKERCLSHLGIALRFDRSYAELIDDEKDFDTIRDDADFVELVRTIARVA